MSAGITFTGLILLVVASLTPAIIYLSWIRSSERYRTDPWGTILGLFGYGALVATVVALFVETVLVSVGTAASQAYPAPEFTFLNGDSTIGAFVLVLVFAPLVEEAIKAAGVVRKEAEIRVVADGPVFGASVGLGFGFFETFLYGVTGYLAGGLLAGIALVLVRSMSSVLLHGSTTAMFGYGYASSKLEKNTGAAGIYYLLAVAMHSSFNALASLGAIVVALGYSNVIGGYADALGLLVAIAFAIGAINHVVSVIHRTSFPAAGGSLRYSAPSIVRRPRPPGPGSAGR
jgi:RsiW-degrading membrane proteinase PrsW (M82 family)